MATIPEASATPTGAVAFANAKFGGYASGTELHVGAVTAGTTTLAGVDQAFSGASTSTSGLTTEIKSETGNVVQPALSGSVNSYGRGSGVEIGLGTSSVAGKDPNQITLAGLAEQQAAPNGPLVTKQIGPINLSPVADVSLASGRAAATFFPASCPIGQPLSYGNGNLTSASVLNLPGSAAVLQSGGSGVTSTDSYTYLSPNGDGSFGLSSVAEETVAPLSVNLLNLFTVKVTVAGANPAAPIDLLSQTTGEAGGGKVSLINGGLVTVTLQAAGGAPVTIAQVNLANPSTLGTNGFLHIPISTSALGPALTSLSDAIGAVLNGLPLTSPVTSPLASLFTTGGPLNGLLTTTGNTASSVVSKLANVSLGSIDIDARPHAINGPVTSNPTIVGGTEAAGAIDLVSVNLALSGSVLGITVPSALTSIDLANVKLGHLEAAAADSAPIACTIPIIKTADPTSVTAGHNFTYNIFVPDPADVDTIACNLENLTVTDTISDNSGSSTFQVNSASDGGKIVQMSANSATVTWTGLSYTAGSTPLDLSIGLDVPGSSPSGVIQDVVVANATTGGCTGGTSGVTDIGANAGLPTNGVGLTGSYKLVEPGVTGVAAPTVVTVPRAAPTAATTLPFTGAMGGLWQPFAGLGALALGGGTLAMVRRSRRLGRK